LNTNKKAVDCYTPQPYMHRVAACRCIQRLFRRHRLLRRFVTQIEALCQQTGDGHAALYRRLLDGDARATTEALLRRLAWLTRIDARVSADTVLLLFPMVHRTTDFFVPGLETGPWVALARRCIESLNAFVCAPHRAQALETLTLLFEADTRMQSMDAHLRVQSEWYAQALLLLIRRIRRDNAPWSPVDFHLFFATMARLDAPVQAHVNQTFVPLLYAASERAEEPVLERLTFVEYPPRRHPLHELYFRPNAERMPRQGLATGRYVRFYVAIFAACVRARPRGPPLDFVQHTYDGLRRLLTQFGADVRANAHQDAVAFARTLTALDVGRAYARADEPPPPPAEANEGGAALLHWLGALTERNQQRIFARWRTRPRELLLRQLCAYGEEAGRTTALGRKTFAWLLLDAIEDPTDSLFWDFEERRLTHLQARWGRLLQSLPRRYVARGLRRRRGTADARVVRYANLDQVALKDWLEKRFVREWVVPSLVAHAAAPDTDVAGEEERRFLTKYLLPFAGLMWHLYGHMFAGDQ
jgi:hypothetical protein